MMKVDSPAHVALTLGLFALVGGGILIANEFAVGDGWPGALRIMIVTAGVAGLSTMIVFKGARRAR